MNSSQSIQKLSEAISQAQAKFRAVGKSGENKFDRYVYAKLEDYVLATRPILSEFGLSIVTSVDETVALDDRKTQKGGIEHAVRVKVTARIMHTSGEWIEAACWGEGQDRADKAVYKAITGARKYALASALGLATSDDPEADEEVGNTPAPRTKQQPSATLATEDQVAELDRLIVETNTTRATVQKWLNKAGVEFFDQMPAESVQKCINVLKAKLQPAGVA
jgi:hypothetical protein